MATIPQRIQELKALMAAFTVLPIDPGDATRGHYAVLPMVRVWEWSGEGSERRRKPGAVGLSAMRKSLQLRGNIDGLFASPDLLDRLITASSGHIRDLFRLMQDVLREVVNQDDPRFPLGAEAVDLIVADYVSTCQKAIYKEDHAFLREVAATQRVRADNEAQIQRITKLMDTQLVMNYRNGVEWFDVSVPVQRILEGAP